MARKKVILPETYAYEFVLEGDIRLKMLAFSHEEHRLIYTYRYVIREGHKTTFVNEFNLCVDYHNGILTHEFTLSMNMVFLERVGKEYLLGVDVSPNSKLYVQFHYQKYKTDPTVAYRLKAIEVGGSKYFELQDSNLPFVPIDFPFPISDPLEEDFGSLSVPIRLRSNDDTTIRVDTSIIR